MHLSAEPKFEEQFTAFIDLLGFKEYSARTDIDSIEKRKQVLDFLLSLSALQGEFDVQPQNYGNHKMIRPAVSTFSDHIVVSYPTKAISPDTGFDEQRTVSFIRSHFDQLVRGIAAAALRIGFLVRGGATIGMLHHSRGAVFGKALVDAYDIESRVSVYPRVVVSGEVTSRSQWIENQDEIVRGGDGLYHFDYFRSLALSSARLGPDYAAKAREWLDEVILTIDNNLREHRSGGRLAELAKWSWFASEFRARLEEEGHEPIKGFVVPLDSISWPR